MYRFAYKLVNILATARKLHSLSAQTYVVELFTEDTHYTSKSDAITSEQ